MSKQQRFFLLDRYTDRIRTTLTAGADVRDPARRLEAIVTVGVVMISFSLLGVVGAADDVLLRNARQELEQRGDGLGIVKRFLSQVRSGDAVASLNDTDWSTMRDRLKSFAANRRVGNAPKSNADDYDQILATVLFGLGRHDEAWARLRDWCDRQSPDESLSQNAVNIARTFIAPLDVDAANRIYRQALERSASEADASQLRALKMLHAIRDQTPRFIDGPWLSAATDPVLVQCDPDQVAEVLFIRPSIMGDGSRRESLVKDLADRVKTDRSRVLLCVRMMEAASEQKVISRWVKMLESVDYDGLPDDELVEQAKPVALLFAGRTALVKNELEQAIANLRDAENGFSRRIRRLIQRQRAATGVSAKRIASELWQNRLNRARVRLNLANASFNDRKWPDAISSYQAVGEDLRQLRRAISGDIVSMDAKMKSAVSRILSQMSYSRYVGMIQIYVARGQMGEAELVLFDLHNEGELADSLSGSIGMRLQDAKNRLALGQWYLQTLALEREGRGQRSIQSIRGSDEEKRYRRMGRLFDEIQELATDFLDNEAQELSRVEIASVVELRGIAGFFRMNNPALDFETPAADRVLVSKQVLDDLTIAASSFESIQGYEFRAGKPRLMIAQLRMDASQFEAATELLDDTLAIAEASGNANTAISALVLRGSIKHQLDLPQCHEDWALARTKIEAGLPSGKEAMYVNWSALYEPFDYAIDASLDEVATFDEEELPSRRSVVDLLIQAIGVMWQADVLCDRTSQSSETGEGVSQKVSAMLQAPAASEVGDWVRARLFAAEPSVVVRVTDRATHVIGLGKVFGKQGFAHHLLPRGRVRWQATIEDLLAKLTQRPSDPKATTAELVSELADIRNQLFPKPFEKAFRNHGVTDVICHGALTRLPLAVLFADKEFIPAIRSTTWKVAAEPQELLPVAQTCKQYIGLAIRDFPGSTLAATLKNAHREIELVATRFESSVLRLDTQNDATWQTLNDDISDTSRYVLHLATHGIVDEENQRSALILLDDDNPAGRVQQITPAMIRDQNWKRCRLAILSSCRSNTSATPQIYGAGVTIASAVRQAGASEVVASLWNVDDDAALAVIDSMMRLVFAGENAASVSESLASAVNEIRQQTDFNHPYFWAPYVVLR